MLLIRSENPHRSQAENPLKLLSEFTRPALFEESRLRSGFTMEASFAKVRLRWWCSNRFCSLRNWRSLITLTP